jgi:hypothetical protein
VTVTVRDVSDFFDCPRSTSPLHGRTAKAVASTAKRIHDRFLILVLLADPVGPMQRNPRLTMQRADSMSRSAFTEDAPKRH